MMRYVTAAFAARCALLALAMFACGAPTAADVAEYPVAQLEWRNNGAYGATVSVRWRDADTGEEHSSVYGCRKKGGESVPASTQEIMPGQFARCILDRIAAERTALTPGDEVWLHINILSGENKTCKKDDMRLYYDPASTQRATYSSGGTTLNNNRCKWRGFEEI